MSAKILDVDDLTVLDTVTLTESGTYYTGTTSETGTVIFEVLVSGSKVDAFVRTIEGDAPHIILESLEGSTLDSVNAAILAAIKAKTDTIGSVTFIISDNAVSSGGSLVIKAGDRHEFTITSDTADVVPDLTGETIRFGVKGNGGVQLLETTDVTVLVATGLQSVQIVLTPAQTILLSQGAYHFDIQAEYSTTDHRTLVTGSVQVNPDYSGAP